MIRGKPGLLERIDGEALVEERAKQRVERSVEEGLRLWLAPDRLAVRDHHAEVGADLDRMRRDVRPLPHATSGRRVYVPEVALPRP